MYRGKPVVREIQTDMTELVAEYIQRHGTIHASCDGAGKWSRDRPKVGVFWYNASIELKR